MFLLNSELYQEDIQYVSACNFSWSKLKNCKILISGATGMIGSFLVDVLMFKNQNEQFNCSIIAVGRNSEIAKNRFRNYLNHQNFAFISQDINEPIGCIGEADYVIHAASNTHPIAYSSDPIGTITTNVIGNYNLLEYATRCKVKRYVYVSSVEIYGENRGDTDSFDENYCGYINSNTLRAGYPESKRAGESLCQAYIKAKELDIVIPRLSRVYGPTMLGNDSKAVAQFIKKGVAKEDIVLKSKGEQFYSYTYVADAVAGILAVLLEGSCGEAYNISDDKSDISLKDLAELIAEYNQKKVIFEIPDSRESAGYSTATKAILNSTKIHSLGWQAKYDIETGICRTIDILDLLNTHTSTELVIED